MKIAYIDCFSGISGDMFLGALIDAGVPLAVFEQTVAALNVGARLSVHTTDRSGISATKVDVLVNEEVDRPRVEHEHYLPHRHGHTHEHSHEKVIGHTHHITETVVAEAEHEHGNHEHHHRGLHEIREIIQHAHISATAQQTAIRIFEALGAAEAKIHNIDIEQIHFHEVGAVDAIVDIVCAAVGAEALGVDEFVCSPLNVGSGTVKCAHGEFPVPAPATAELLRDAPVFSSGIRAELVTPTGAAIVKVLANRFQPLPGMRIEKIGYGAGTRDFPGHANVTRILIGSSGADAKAQSSELLSVEGARETICVLEANVDDMNPQVFGYLLERALDSGALDVFGTAVQMKKSRMGMLITVLCKPEDAQRLTNLIFAETTSLGVRMREEKRAVLLRRSISVQTQWGEVRMKVANLNGTTTNYAPEYEDCRRIAETNRIPLKQVMQDAVRIYLEQEKKNG
jgi:pyridinium-3,5-bisthiocarboxylic acid mononucleotide nickel chelatase